MEPSNPLTDLSGMPFLTAFRTSRAALGAPKWFVFDGCHRAVALAIRLRSASALDGIPGSQKVGKRFEDWPLRLCLVGGSGRHDPHPMTCDGQPADQRSPARAIDQIMAGTGPCALVFHAYGSAKAFGSVLAEAMLECIRVPFTIWGGDGLVSSLLPPPSFLQSARSGWTRLVRFQGIDIVLKLPSHPTHYMKVSIILDGLNASGPLPTDDILLGVVLWIANGTMWGATTTTYGATMQEVCGNTYFTGELGSSQMSSYRNALLAWPN